MDTNKPDGQSGGLTMAVSSPTPKGCVKILKLLKAGHTLHGSPFGMFLMSPIDARCYNVNEHTARALRDRGLISKTGGCWVSSANT